MQPYRPPRLPTQKSLGVSDLESILIEPFTHPLSGTVDIPGSKSLTNRAMLIAALANGSTRLTNALFSDDSRYFAEALKTLGFELEHNQKAREIRLTGEGGRIPSASATLFIGNAGTAARFLSAFLTLGGGEYILDGDSRMRERPIGDLISALTQLGAKISPAFETSNGNLGAICPPVKILASGLPGGKTSISGSVSSQFLSGLLMVAPYALSPVEIDVMQGLNSKPYVDMTIGVMKDFGVTITRNGYESFRIDSGRYQASDSYAIEPDASAASYFFAAPAILGGHVRIENISRKSKQGDVLFVDILQKMGCSVREGVNFIEVHGPASKQDLLGIDVDMSDIPDTAQTLAAIAPFAKTPTCIRGIQSARAKESDRVSATCAELVKLGVRVEENWDGMIIYPCENITPAMVRTYNDHRMAMSFALIGYKHPGVQIENPGCVSKTFPNYFDVWERLR
jgi:3-phosphoshikimate 1-carboxyvinyltransferase